jgi:hypothetical protein
MTEAYNNKKTIDTLVEDIYSLFDESNDVQIDDKAIDAFLEGVRASVISSLTRKRGAPYLRLSMVGQPDRKIWYELNGAPKEPLTKPTHIKFLYGDILEHLLVLLSKLSGHDVTEQQDELSVEGVVGHQDAVVDGTLVDFKSASPHSFKKFKDGSLSMDDPFGYIAQISSYAFAGKHDRAGFVAIDKVSGEIHFHEVHKRERIDPSKRIVDLKRIVDIPVPPKHCHDPVPDGKSGNMKLATACSFCDFKKHCWSSSNNGAGLRAFKYSNGVRYLTSVASTPDVEEVFET